MKATMLMAAVIYDLSDTPCDYCLHKEKRNETLLSGKPYIVNKEACIMRIEAYFLALEKGEVQTVKGVLKNEKIYD